MYVDNSIMVEAICMLGENYEALLEAYVGKPKELLKCEEYLSHIIDELNAEYVSLNTSSGVITQKKVTKDYEWNKKLEIELANFFKVNKVNIYWTSGSSPNISTISHLNVFIFNNRKKYLSGSSSNLTIDICIREECITITGLTASELMASILHEIGHNFYFCPITMGFEIFALIVATPVEILKQLMAKLTIKGALAISDLMKKYIPIIYNFIQLFNNYNYQFKQLFLPLNLIDKISTAVSKMILIGPVDILKGITGYGDETAADSMCAKYGYGPEQASALTKLRNPKNGWTTNIEKNDGSGVTSIMHDLSIMTLEIVSMMTLDPHPNSNQRAANMLKKLKRDLATGDYPDGMKKDLENEINRMEDVFNICSKNTSPSSIQIRQSWFDAINSITGNNSDLRQIFAFYYEPLGF